jgi:hypothetical protein
MVMKYFPEDEPAAERFLLIVKESSDGSNREFGHLRATVVRAAVSHYEDPDNAGRMIYEDDTNATGYRWAYWSSNKSNAIYVNKLALRCQLDLYNHDGSRVPDEKRVPYGTDYAFYDPYRIDRREAVCIAEAFKKLDGRFAVMNKNFSSLDTKRYAEITVRFAHALGIKRILSYSKFSHGTSLAEMDNFLVSSVVDTSYIVDKLVEQFNK